MYASRPLVIIIVCFALALILGGGLVWPEYRSLKAAQVEISQKEANLKTEKDYFAKVENLSAELENNKSEMAKIDSALPKSPSVPDFLNFLQDASSQSGLVLLSLGSATVSSDPGKTVKETRLSFQVAGSYAAFKNFLSVLEKSARIINVEAISFSSPRDPKGNFIFNLTIMTNSY